MHDRSSGVFALSLLASVLSLAALESSGQGLSVENIRSAYQQNALASLPYSVDIRHSITKAQEELPRLLKEREEVEHLLGKEGISDAERDMYGSLRSQLDRHISSLQNDEIHYRYRVFASRDGVQIQVPNAFTDGHATRSAVDSFQFAKDMPSTETLLREFKGYSIFACSESKSTYLTWTQSESDSGQGWISDHPFNLSQAPYQLPPMGRAREQWASYGLLSAFDLSTSGPVDDLTILGNQVVEGQSVVVVEKAVKKKDTLSAELPKGNHQVEEYSRTYFAPSKGFIPLRIEQGKRWLFNDMVVNDGFNPPDTVVTVIETQNVGDAIIPKRVRIDHYKTYSDKPIVGVPTPAEFRQGKTYEFPRVVYMTEEMSLENVARLNPQDTPQLIFDFPCETRYFDARIGRSLIMCMTADELDRRTLAAFPPIEKTAASAPGQQTGSAPRSYFLIFNVAAVVFMLTLVIYRRYSASA